ncbi:unnamed protein product [Aphanomyces euteiches]|nr:hypothetical protein Ae201684P_012180 [Aphanomyces euteiches]KAH9149686.1 hypothetical protein AeRB84_007311 [Aphanomyces euteiches]
MDNETIGKNAARFASMHGKRRWSWRRLFGSTSSSKQDDKTLDIFKTAPSIKVKSVRVQDDWPVKSIEYEVELGYHAMVREIYLPKANMFRLWLYIKGLGMMDGPNTADDAAALPQLRDFFFANAQNSSSPDMLTLLESYLNAVMALPRVRSSAYVLSLLQISGSTFSDDGNVTSMREGWLKARLWLKGGQDNVRLHRGAVMCDNGCFNCFCVVKKYTWRPSAWKWISLQDSCLAVYDSNRDLAPTDVMLFDPDFKLDLGLRSVGSAKELVVSNGAYVLHAKAKHKNDCIKWANAIRAAVEASEWTAGRHHRDGSFAAPRRSLKDGAKAQWYVDGQDTFAAMLQAIESAKTQLFIAGWWICPTIYLTRPAQDNARLDAVLKRRAEAGVQIYILMYKEISMALTLDSQFAKTTLRRLHPNVHVLRDPDFIMKHLGLYSHHEKILCVDQSVAFVGGLDLCFGRWDTASHALFEPMEKMFPGKDYSNPRIKDFVQVNRPEEDLMDRNVNPRMPWHDCHCKLVGDPARDVARHFIQRWNYSVSTRFKGHRFQHLVPKPSLKPSTPLTQTMKSPSSVSVSVDGFSASRRVETPNEASVVPLSIVAEMVEHGQEDGIPVTCQIVRSLSMWSGGCRTEKSIQNAYVRLINDAKHFIYIENQFFVSSHGCSNLIVNALVGRIVRAYAAKETFRVMVVLPLLPAFQGKPQEKEAYSLRGVMHWQYRSICRGESSLYGQLAAAGIPNAFEYIAFFGLRTHAIHNGVPHTEEIYIHSKVMIVDDSHTIIGSANINERSLTGDRDSEIAAVIDDVAHIDSVTLRGAVVGRFGHSFRMRLFQEHFGVDENGAVPAHAVDPTSDQAWITIRQQAMSNTTIYDAVFGCLPVDSVVSFRDMGVTYATNHFSQTGAVESDDIEGTTRRFETTTTTIASVPTTGGESQRSLRSMSMRERENESNLVFTKAMRTFRREQTVTIDMQHRLANIRGHIVYFPLQFLQNEDLEPKYMPAELFQ